MKMRSFLAILAFLVTVPAFAYDSGLADRLAEFYQPFEGKACAKSLQMIPPADFVKAMRAETKPFVLDVRTEAETGLIGVTATDSLTLPMARVFSKETLEQLPTDRKIVVVCKGGHRATAVAMGCGRSASASFMC